MRVTIHTKNWRGNYNWWELSFKDEKHLENYLAKCNRDQTTSRVIGYEILK